MKKLSLIFCLTIYSSILFAQETERAQKVRTRSNSQNEKASSIPINNSTMPNRISMTATFGKQTIAVNLTEGGAVVLFPDKTGLKINSVERTITEMTAAEYRNSMNVTVPKQTQAATFGEKVNAGLQHAGSIVSATISGVASAAAAATSGKVAQIKLPDNETDITINENLPDGEYELSFVIGQRSEKGLKDTLKTNVKLYFSNENGLLKIKHDTAKNSISNVR